MTRVKRIVGIVGLVVGALWTTAQAQEMKLVGAGATFPQPLYEKWAAKYAETTGVKVNYQGIGSGGGIKQIKAKTVDFGGTDAPLSKDDLDASGLVQFPVVVGGVVPVINVKDIKSGEIRMTGALLADIFLGKVTKWNDAAIRQINPNVALPDLAITVVHRTDGSGTTAIFTDYLSKVSPDWKEKVGQGSAVNWPTGLGGKGNPGVAQYVTRVTGAIGYVEFAYALQNDIPYVLMRNADGKYAAPTLESFQAAAANADWTHAPGYCLSLTEQPGEASWPITGATFILVYAQQTEPAKAQALLKYFNWCFENGGKMAEELHYVPMPQSVVDLVRATWKSEITIQGRPASW